MASRKVAVGDVADSGTMRWITRTSDRFAFN